MHRHNEYFWLREELGDQASAAFEQGLKLLAAVPLIQHRRCVRPAETNRTVVENSFSYGLVFGFKDKAAQDRYQEGKTHQLFLDDHSEKWQKVIVYDSESS